MELLSSRQRAQEPVGLNSSELTSEHVCSDQVCSFRCNYVIHRQTREVVSCHPGAPGCTVGFSAATFLRMAITGHDRSAVGLSHC